MVRLFEKIQTNDGVRPALKLVMLGHLKKNDDKDKFTRLLPPGVRVAHKDGAVSDARTDAGILYTPAGVLVVCVLTERQQGPPLGTATTPATCSAREGGREPSTITINSAQQGTRSLSRDSTAMS